MTPFDGTRPKPSDPGEPIPAPNDPGDARLDRDTDITIDLEALPAPTQRPDPGDTAMWDVIANRYEGRIRELEDEIAALRRTVSHLGRHNRQMQGMLHDATQREYRLNRALIAAGAPYNRLSPLATYPQGLGGAGQCDCTMSRADLLTLRDAMAPAPGLRQKVYQAIRSLRSVDLD